MISPLLATDSSAFNATNFFAEFSTTLYPVFVRCLGNFSVEDPGLCLVENASMLSSTEVLVMLSGAILFTAVSIEIMQCAKQRFWPQRQMFQNNINLLQQQPQLRDPLEIRAEARAIYARSQETLAIVSDDFKSLVEKNLTLNIFERIDSFKDAALEAFLEVDSREITEKLLQQIEERPYTFEFLENIRREMGDAFEANMQEIVESVLEDLQRVVSFPLTHYGNIQEFATALERLADVARNRFQHLELQGRDVGLVGRYQITSFISSTINSVFEAHAEIIKKSLQSQDEFRELLEARSGLKNFIQLAASYVKTAGIELTNSGSLIQEDPGLLQPLWQIADAHRKLSSLILEHKTADRETDLDSSKALAQFLDANDMEDIAFRAMRPCMEIANYLPEAFQ